LHKSNSFRSAVSELSRLLEPLVEAGRKPPPPKMGFMEEDEESARLRAEEYKAHARGLANRILGEALEHGVPQVVTEFALSELSGGVASDFVFRARTQMSFIVKVQRDPKLRDEALWLASRHPDVEGATPWGSLFPRVLSKQLDGSPYAYAMEDFRKEDGYQDLAAWIFDAKLLPAVKETQASLLLGAVLDTLAKVYSSSVNTNSRPNLDGEAYLKRIEGRMAQAEEMFKGFASPKIFADGVPLPSWRTCVEEIKEKRVQAEALFPRFETAVHGDSHPGNILVRLQETTGKAYEPEIRLIDPKAWTYGDYVFDFAKVGHYVELTGPVERLGAGSSFEFQLRGDDLIMKNLPDIPEWIIRLSKTVSEKAVSLGKALGDDGAGPRYGLAMASAFLGTVPLRWSKGQKALALMMYSEGLRYLSLFCRALKN
jgi:aminoglycoside phosphotransferase (APT) family kinase protein